MKKKDIIGIMPKNRGGLSPRQNAFVEIFCKVPEVVDGLSNLKLNPVPAGGQIDQASPFQSVPPDKSAVARLLASVIADIATTSC